MHSSQKEKNVWSRNGVAIVNAEEIGYRIIGYNSTSRVQNQGTTNKKRPIKYS